jgi:hypothetical protein
MKLIISGSTGFVGTEVLRQALSHPVIKEVVSLARRETAVPQNLAPGANPAKLKSIICEDLLNYPENVREELKGADACIWLDLSHLLILPVYLSILNELRLTCSSYRLLAVTPSKSRLLPWEEVRKICYDYAVTGLKTIAEQQQSRPTSRPLRFIYVSGSTVERDQSRKHWIFSDYMKLRVKFLPFSLYLRLRKVHLALSILLYIMVSTGLEWSPALTS